MSKSPQPWVPRLTLALALLRAVKAALRAKVPGCAAAFVSAPSRHESRQAGKERRQAAEGRDRGCAADLSARARAVQARHLAGGGLRRSRPRSARGSRGE